MLTAADVGLVTTALKGLNADEDLIAEIVALLNSNSDGLTEQRVTDVGPDWFGGSTTGHRIGVNTKMAHQEVEQEFQKLADSLRAYSDAIQQWADEVRDVDGTTNAEMTMRQSALAQVNTTLAEARDRAASRTMGDGQFTEPPAGEGGA